MNFGDYTMKIRIVVDSSANMEYVDGVDFASVPLTIQAGDKSYVWCDAHISISQ